MLLAHPDSLELVAILGRKSAKLLLQKGGFVTLRRFERVLWDIKGFSLAEMMATAGVLAVLVAVAVPNYLAFKPSTPGLPSARAVMIRPLVPEERPAGGQT